MVLNGFSNRVSIRFRKVSIWQVDRTEIGLKRILDSV